MKAEARADRLTDIAFRRRTGVVNGHDIDALLAEITDLITEKTQTEGEAEILRKELQAARDLAKSAGEVLRQLKAGIEALRADAARVGDEVSSGKAIAYETILGSIACLPYAVRMPLAEVRDPNPSVSRGLCAGRPMFRISAPDDCVVEICWLSPKNGAGKFWQIRDRPGLGSVGLEKDGTDALDAYAALNRPAPPVEREADAVIREIMRRLRAAETML